MAFIDQISEFHLAFVDLGPPKLMETIPLEYIESMSAMLTHDQLVIAMLINLAEMDSILEA